MKRYRDKLILDVLDILFFKVCLLFDWVEHRISKNLTNIYKREK